MTHRGNPKGVGRPKGSRNKLTVETKRALEMVFDRRGGVEALRQWSHQNPDGFYALWGKLLPREIKGESPHGGKIEVVIVRDGDERVAG